MATLDIQLEKITDPATRDAFYSILEFVRKEPSLNFGFKFFNLVFTSGVTNYQFMHKLGYKPKDAIITDVSNNESAFVNMDNSTSTFLDVTASGACTVRIMVGNLDVNSQA